MKIHAFKPNNTYFGQENTNKTKYKPNKEIKYLKYSNEPVLNSNYNKKGSEVKDRIKIFSILAFGIGCLVLGLYKPRLSY